MVLFLSIELQFQSPIHGALTELRHNDYKLNWITTTNTQLILVLTQTQMAETPVLLRVEVNTTRCLAVL